MLAQSVIIVLCIPVLAGTIYSAGTSFGIMLGILFFTVNQQGSNKAPNDNTSNTPHYFCSWLAGLI